MRPLRVLVVDDSAVNRRIVSQFLTGFSNVQVIGTAADGDEALKVVAAHAPDLITLDLEMPRMDGFTFLRLLMATRPTPVVVISSHDGRESVFRALELGAIDFVAKPSAMLAGSNEAIRVQLENVVSIVRQLAPSGPWRQRRGTADFGSVPAPETTPMPPPVVPEPPRELSRIVAIAASTGGPTALMELFAQLPARSNSAVLVAQHMPERFTRSFAERLDRASSFRVREAEHLHELVPGSALVSPGGRCLELQRQGDQLVARVVFPATTDRHAPSADRLFTSVAQAVGARAVGVVLTGMGDDAAKGVVDIKNAGGLVLAEAEESAVVHGMPKAAIVTGCVDEVLPLPRLVQRIRELLS